MPSNKERERAALGKLADWRFRLNNLYKIVNKKGQLVTFRENGIQRLINNSTSLRKRILKYRQGGVSTNEILKSCDAVFFHRNMTACLLAHQNDGLEILFNMARGAYKFMPDELKPRLDRGGGSKYEMYFPDLNSRIYADLEVRGGTINRLHISEAAFADKNRIKATKEAVPIETGIVTEETTPNGMGNHFYRGWVDKDDAYEKMFFPWYVDPQYSLDPSTVKDLTDDEREFIKKAKRLYGTEISLGQIAFRRFKQRELKELFNQEYPEDEITCFLASGNAPFDLNLIQSLINNAPPPISDDGTTQVFKDYQPGAVYVMGCDTAEGVRKDYSVAVLIDARDISVVAVYRSNKVKPGDFAKAIKDLGQLYQRGGSAWPLVAVERNNHGHAVLLALDQILSYPNLYRDEKDQALGWKTNMVSRPIMIDTLIEAIEEKQISINSTVILYECLTLVDNGGKIEAEEGEHDDGIVASAIALQMAIKHGRFDQYNDLSSKILL